MEEEVAVVEVVVVAVVEAVVVVVVVGAVCAEGNVFVEGICLCNGGIAAGSSCGGGVGHLRQDRGDRLSGPTHCWLTIRCFSGACLRFDDKSM